MSNSESFLTMEEYLQLEAHAGELYHNHIFPIFESVPSAEFAFLLQQAINLCIDSGLEEIADRIVDLMRDIGKQQENMN